MERQREIKKEMIGKRNDWKKKLTKNNENGKDYTI